MNMKLRCQLKGANCPPFNHKGIFHPDNETIKGLLPDLNRCTNCMACTSPSLPNFREALLQIASITLLEKGLVFNPLHKSRASFGTFIRPRICVSLTNAKRKELIHQERERLDFHREWNAPAVADSDDNKELESISTVPDRAVDAFVDALVWDISVANFEKALPQLLQRLTNRERQVFACICEDMRNSDIAEALKLSKGRASQLVQQVEMKLKHVCQEFGLVE